MSAHMSLSCNIPKVQTGQNQTNLKSMPVLFFVNHQPSQFCHIPAICVTFSRISRSVFICSCITASSDCSKSDRSELSAGSAVVVSAASNDQPMSNDQPNELQRETFNRSLSVPVQCCFYSFRVVVLLLLCLQTTINQMSNNERRETGYQCNVVLFCQ